MELCAGIPGDDYPLVFTLNETGWKFAEQIDMLWNAMSGIIPSQKQMDEWVKNLYDERKREFAEFKADMSNQ